ncbi:hypothetical protein V2J09_013583 [Rumex salicifolius]
MSAALIPRWRSSAWLFNLVVVVNGGIFLLLLLLLPTSVESRNSTAAAEVKAFNTIFSKLGITSNIKWNTTEDPCSGVAVEDSITIDDTSHNPFIKCDCSFDNGTTCHITALKIYALDVVGQIPDEIWTLTYLTNLNLAQNYLTGSISPSIGNLTKMQWLTFGINALSGNLPKEIGKLTQLKSLGISTNNFSGSLPSDLGNIDGLQQLYMDSSGFVGEIPRSFSNFLNMQTMWASDAEFNGSMPEFIGNWTQLTDLRLEGNSFVGSIPSSFSNLTALQTLRIGDLSNGSSSLAFITNLTSLTTLVLRNIHFSDSIPTEIGGLSNLNYLDLSFNKISGKIPSSLFSLGSLNFLFLGNNKLTGTLPSNKSSSLTNIDVSYNQLSGTIPSWMDNKTQLNLVANNFTGIRNSFAVTCGGPQIKASDETVFEKESAALGPATYYVADTKRWGVSNVGSFLFSNNASYVAYSMRQFSNTLDPELFQTARLSPGSLRYYGLGLENGNYTVFLQFAELVIQNGKTWRSLGRRVFDIYIQGKLALKNFDIRKAAGAVSYSVVKSSFNATVTSNHLEIHLLWAGKGTCCVPVQGTYGPSISAISIIPNFIPTVSNRPPSGPMKNKLILILAIALPIGCICLFLVCCCTIQTSTKLMEARKEGATAGIATVLLIFDCYWLYRMQKRRKEKRQRAKNFARNGGLLLQEMAFGDCIAEKTKIFTARELEKATDRFNKSRILGQGGQGIVYKGMLVDGRIVAIKKSNIVDDDQCHQFINEVVILSQINHRNVVKLLGCCLETDVPLLVYEFVPNDTLYHHLHEPNEDFHITWKMRLQIATESACALAYIHSSSSVPIYHRDIKSSNILLDEKYRAKVSDFGISRTITIDEQTHLTTIVQGTMGYLDPEYFRSHQFNDKSDVYSFGVVLLELITGKKPIVTTNSGDKKVLVTWFLQMMEVACLHDILDPRIVDEAKEEEALAVSNLATRCLNMNGKQRPTMKEVTMILESIRSFTVLNPLEELCVEVNRATHEVCKTQKCPYCSRLFVLEDASSSSSLEVLPLLSNYTF